MEDASRLEFIKQLDAAEVEVTKWEAQFLGSFIDNPRAFTPDQRRAADEMRERYKDEL
jgi:hypothetical protein